MSGDFPREPVPAEHATRNAASISFIVINAVIGIPIMLLGGSLGRGFSLSDAALVIVAGCSLTACIAMLTAWAGVRSRCSTALLAERSFGRDGAKVMNFAVGIALLGWFAVEMGFIGQLLASSLKLTLGVHMPLAAGVIAASIAIGLVGILGIGIISRAPMVFVPLLAILIAFIVWAAIPQLSGMTATISAPMSIGTGISAVVGGFGLGVLILPDYSRFIGRTGNAITAVGIALGPVWMVVLGAYAAAGLVTQSADPTAMLLALGLPAIVTLFLPLGLVQNGVMCLYSSSLATSTWLRRVRFAHIVAGTAIIGAILAILGVQEFFVGFLVLTSSVFPPAAAILAFDALFGSVDRTVPAKVRWSGLGIWAAATMIAILSEHWGIGLTGISTLDGFSAAFLLSIAVRVLQARTGSKPAIDDLQDQPSGSV